jgi:tRNA dimethylallyltransferase
LEITNKNYLVCLVGPTAVGKTALAIKIAKHFNTEIISADSRQFYKEISIGTAKPSFDELSQVSHHFINNKSVQETYSAGDFERDALLTLNELFKKNNLVVLAGGSGLYINALCDGLDEMPEVDNELRNELIGKYQLLGIEYLQNRLNELNPNAFAKIDKNNPQRLMRAIEIAMQTPENKKKILKSKRPFECIKICLNMEREMLYKNINERVDAMINSGLIKECEQMAEFKNHYALKTVGYNEIFDFFEGKTDLPKAIELIKQHTRNYAKRQITWFRKDENMNWFKPSEEMEIFSLINKIVST